MASSCHKPLQKPGLTTYRLLQPKFLHLQSFTAAGGGHLTAVITCPLPAGTKEHLCVSADFSSFSVGPSEAGAFGMGTDRPHALACSTQMTN